VKTVFIGDIHGRFEVLDFVEKQFPEHEKIFVGDFVDAFDRTRAEQLACIKKVLEMIDKGNTKAILGNHELSYLVPREMKCTGYAGTMDALLLPLKNEMWKKFEHYIWMPEHQLLVTHAGLSNYLFKGAGLTLDNLEVNLEQWKKEQWYKSFNGWIGRARGGLQPVGGIFWCDFNDEFAPIEGLKQVFGHTNLVDTQQDHTYGIREREPKNFCVDCLSRKPEFLEFDSESKKFKILTFDKKEVFGEPVKRLKEDDLEKFRGYNG